MMTCKIMAWSDGASDGSNPGASVELPLHIDATICYRQHRPAAEIGPFEIGNWASLPLRHDFLSHGFLVTF
ncbi:MAG: hypothetical protein DI554_02685 [Sphingobium sp.]|nr:MAG: hypothetical protein DI554_02685 [Sphingobium sp.]